MRRMAHSPRTVATLLALAGLALLPTAGRAQPVPEGRLRPLNIATPEHFFFRDQQRGVVWAATLPSTGGTFVRIHFAQIRDQTDADYRVVVLDASGTLRVELPKAGFGRQESFWTGVVPGDSPIIEIRAAALPRGLSFVVKEIAYQAEMPRPESIVGDADWEPLDRAPVDPRLAAAARAVVKLSFVRDGEPDACSGFMIADDRLVTNEHCVSSPDVCGPTVRLFGFDPRPDGSVTWGYEARCLEVVHYDPQLDFAVLRVEGTPGRADQWGAVSLATRRPGAGESLYLVEHPGGGRKMVSRANCRVKTPVADGRFAMQSDFGHTCDTAGGSSGSPVFDTNFTVVGLHHLGFQWDSPRWRAENRAVLIDPIRLQLVAP